ncbi:hypothetical protein KTE23_11245 [Burkholderia multivorans]|uniref:hypothetical protein n=1 Tax=Burkholderia multivorans TaxID=87883 RepID=UPI001C22E0B3|nr:hypothetical protein [Burkholderia multivorans]MBU9417146.1 hypothetical protein [Burkholderia multivorans]
MRKIIAMVASSCVLVGCVSFGQMEKGLDALRNQPVSTAVQVLGYPAGEREAAGMKIVHWGRQQTGLMPLTSYGQNSGFGAVGSTPFSYTGTTTSTQYVPLNFNCEIDIAIGPGGFIQGYQYSGNIGGCSPYIKALNRYRESIGAN